MGSHCLSEPLPDLEGWTNQMPKRKTLQDRTGRTKPHVESVPHFVRQGPKVTRGSFTQSKFFPNACCGDSDLLLGRTGNLSKPSSKSSGCTPHVIIHNEFMSLFRFLPSFSLFFLENGHLCHGFWGHHINFFVLSSSGWSSVIKLEHVETWSSPPCPNPGS